MKFTTPCFVRVEDAEKRKELAVWLSSIGRYVSPAVTSSDYHKDWVIVTEPYDPDLDGYVGIWAKTPKSPAFIDCGENIELFKALAAMNDENYNEQYFVTELAGSSYCVHKNRNTNLAYSLTCRKATVAEIIEYFKKSEK
ncbi:MAG: hypothetical protein EGS50_01275 [Alistipes senegalensis]|jgi:hypothetical protein|nr:hypothetical protein [Alistipes senegalensis]DAW92416.1 MAG TPA: hypothetical protein [Bacteriophage sp.]